jgi:hypothetical protein
MHRTRIPILGGGFGGVHAALACTAPGVATVMADVRVEITADRAIARAAAS